MSKKAIILILLVVVVMIGAAIGIYIISTQEQDVRTEAAPPVTLTLSPPSGSYAVGETFTLDMLIDSGGNDITSADIVLNYNPNVIKATGVENGGFLPQEIGDPIITPEGVLIYSVYANPAQTGTGLIGTVTFEALNAGTSEVIFSDNTVVAADEDQNPIDLQIDPNNATITVTGTGGIPSPSPSPSSTPLGTPPGATNPPSPSPSSSPGLGTPTPSPSSGATSTPIPTATAVGGGISTPVPSSLPSAGIGTPTYTIVGIGLLFMLFALGLAL